MKFKVKAVNKKTGASWFVGKQIPYGYDTTDNIDEAILHDERHIENMKNLFNDLVIIKIG